MSRIPGDESINAGKLFHKTQDEAIQKEHALSLHTLEWTFDELVLKECCCTQVGSVRVEKGQAVPILQPGLPLS
jgi:hypothetical protein